jgi:hypothetical protein
MLDMSNFKESIMKMYAISETGGLYEMHLNEADTTADECLANIIHPAPCYVGKIGDGAVMYIGSHGARRVIFSMKHLNIRTKYYLKTLPSGQAAMYPGWNYGLPAQMKWQPPYPFRIFLILEFGGTSQPTQRLIVSDLAGNQYPCPIHNVFTDSTICVGGAEIMGAGTDSYNDLSKFMLIPATLNDSPYNNDAGTLADREAYEEIFLWNANTNEQIMIEENSFRYHLTKASNQIPEKWIVPEEHLKKARYAHDD